MSFAEKLAALEARIGAVCAESGRPRTDIRILAVSKTRTVDEVLAAIQAGQRDFGENYAQELQAKSRALQHVPGIRWHFLGRIQSNKARIIADAHLVHGVGATAQARVLADARAQHRAPLPILLQVSFDEGRPGTRNGFPPDELRREFDVICGLSAIEVTGLMTVLPPRHPPRTLFRALRELRDELAARSGHPLPDLSMGMSGDFEDAIREGATWIRVGTLLFGERAPGRAD